MWMVWCVRALINFVESGLFDALWRPLLQHVSWIPWLLPELIIVTAFSPNYQSTKPYPVSSQRCGANNVRPSVLRTHHADSTWPIAMAARTSKNRLEAILTCIQGATWISTSLHQNYCVEVSLRRCLRSSSHRRLVIPPPSKTVLFGERSFAVEGPGLWNHLPDNVKEAGSIELFKQRLKTHLFRQSFEIPAFS